MAEVSDGITSTMIDGADWVSATAGTVEDEVTAGLLVTAEAGVGLGGTGDNVAGRDGVTAGLLSSDAVKVAVGKSGVGVMEGGGVAVVLTLEPQAVKIKQKSIKRLKRLTTFLTTIVYPQSCFLPPIP